MISSWNWEETALDNVKIVLQLCEDIVHKKLKELVKFLQFLFTNR